MMLNIADSKPLSPREDGSSSKHVATNISSYQSIMRVYHQIQEWQGNTLNADDWGWKLSDVTFKLVVSDRVPCTTVVVNSSVVVYASQVEGCGTL
ncbi:hypothetical protein Pcinc_016308 [Petrolisthes cinctipes]|uniref:Uncharacterized protein n=1 Tax=Petrolisthes cinctipes TaxID=88211 RepID=A0AAE1KNX0_PETCI|nr:hypothetical protein Pcinc_016308 [Petrolisthes cinctipes]